MKWTNLKTENPELILLLKNEEEDWKRDIEDNGWSDLRGLDEEFIANGYKLSET